MKFWQILAALGVPHIHYEVSEKEENGWKARER